MDDLGKGSETIGGARSVGHDLVLRLVGIKVDTADKPNDVIHQLLRHRIEWR